MATATATALAFQSELKKLQKEWFENPQWWFRPTREDDDYLRTTYEDLLDTMFDLCKCQYDTISLIILYDQIPRHVYREEPSKHILEFFLQKALALSRAIVGTLDALTDEEFMFAMLPFRHSLDVGSIHKVMGWTWMRIRGKDGKCSDVLKKFLKATYDRCPRTGWGIRNCKMDGAKDTKGAKNTKGAQGAWDAERFHDILEYAPYQLVQRDIEELRDTICYRELHDFAAKNKGPIILSISGGVDSMVCATLLRHFGVVLVGVYINYCNRDKREEEFVVAWCQAMGIPLYVRRFEEIQRGPCMTYELRDTYETYTRDVRFCTYKCVWDMCGFAGVPRVILGHNQDDCFENVLTNIAQKQKMDNLWGMDKVGSASGICFLRPMLGVPKAEIYEVARYVGVPYLQDSTPSWSQRGMIRDHVRPTLEKWHPCIVQEMLGLGQHIQELYGFMNDTIDDMISKLRFGPRGDSGSDGSELRLPLNFKSLNSRLFWKMFFAKAFHEYPSQKSLMHFLARLERGVGSMCVLSKSLRVKCLRDDGGLKISFIVS